MHSCTRCHQTPQVSGSRSAHAAEELLALKCWQELFCLKTIALSSPDVFMLNCRGAGEVVEKAVGLMWVPVTVLLTCNYCHCFRVLQGL